ncbi:MAG: formate dehydrogenase accessory sulfurtransferase FdhD [Acidimicrobiales bacterium]|nr:formate dehydrogenase accessory sulfurtransferase FdhD [Acidimicrobiales bacterium]
MARGRTRSVLTRRLEADRSDRVPDELIVEEPMSIQLDGHLVATTMRTPGDDFELAVGFLHTEGLLAGAPVRRVRYCGTGSAVGSEFNVVTVETGGRAPVPTPRLGPTSSSCGWCGSETVAELAERFPPVRPLRLDHAAMTALAGRVRDAQPLFARTGAVHAAAALAPEGPPLVVREDIGRHNAVDKVVGRLLLDGALPAHGLVLWVSGRVSFEIVQKAWAGGFGAVVAVSAPSALAVETARAAGMQLAGFARGGRVNVYTPDGPDGPAS